MIEAERVRPCELCGRPCFVLDERARFVHPCCRTWFAWAARTCRACEASDERRRVLARRALAGITGPLVESHESPLDQRESDERDERASS